MAAATGKLSAGWIRAPARTFLPAQQPLRPCLHLDCQAETPLPIMKSPNRNRITFFLGILTVFLALESAWAQVPALLSYQAHITAGGKSFHGEGQFKLALVNSDGSTVYWSNETDGDTMGNRTPVWRSPFPMGRVQSFWVTRAWATWARSLRVSSPTRKSICGSGSMMESTDLHAFSPTGALPAWATP